MNLLMPTIIDGKDVFYKSTRSDAIHYVDLLEKVSGCTRELSWIGTATAGSFA